MVCRDGLSWRCVVAVVLLSVRAVSQARTHAVSSRGSARRAPRTPRWCCSRTRRSRSWSVTSCTGSTARVRRWPPSPSPSTTSRSWRCSPICRCAPRGGGVPLTSDRTFVSYRIAKRTSAVVPPTWWRVRWSAVCVIEATLDIPLPLTNTSIAAPTSLRRGHRHVYPNRLLD